MLFKNKNKIIFFLILLFAFLSKGSAVFATLSLSFNDTAIKRGISNEIQLRGTLDPQPLNSVRLVFSFDSRIVDVKFAKGSSSFAITEDNPVFALRFPKIDSAVAEVYSNKVQTINNGIICSFNIEGLVFSDSITSLKLEAVYVNEVQISDYTYSSGIIKVLGDAYLSQLPDAIGNCTPNPFIKETKVDFSIEKKTKVKFLIYNTLGRLASSSDENSFNTFQIFNLDNGTTIKDLSQDFESGNYRLLLTPVSWDFSQGLYYLIMQTDKGAFNTNFMYFKR